MTDKEIMQMALDALLRVWHSERNIKHSEAIEALRARLSQPEPEPVAWWNDMGHVVDLNVSGHGTPLYTAPPQREWQNTADKCELEPVPAKGTLLPAQPEPEPVACDCDSPAWCNQYKKCHRAMLGFEPYVAPPQREWQGLTDEEVWGIPSYDQTSRMYRFARAIEAKLKEKNG